MSGLCSVSYLALKEEEEVEMAKARTKIEPPGCGLANIWWFRGRFCEACEQHDLDYDLHNNPNGTKTLWQVDTDFLHKMIELSDKLRHVQSAMLFFTIAHAYGLARWKGKRT